MKDLVKNTLRWFARPISNEIELELGSKFVNNEVVSQKLLMQQWRSAAITNSGALPSFAEVGFRKYSQFEEDGILLYIFSLIKPLNRTCVEICAGNGRECMVSNLIINHGWWGHLFDGDERNVRNGIRFFANNKDTFLHPPRFNQAWITAENVNQKIEESGIKGPVDLLSLDIDGMDYWIWKAISVVEPQVFVCETHNLIPADKALTVPYDPKFVCQSEEFRGASLAAMCKLSAEKGYRLIGTHRYGFNAFFMKNGVGEQYFPAVDPAQCMNDPYTKTQLNERWAAVKNLGWMEV